MTDTTDTGVTILSSTITKENQNKIDLRNKAENKGNISLYCIHF